MFEYRRTAGRLVIAIALAIGVTVVNCPLMLADVGITSGTYQNVPSGPIAGVVPSSVTVNAPTLTIGNGNISVAGAINASVPVAVSSAVIASQATHIPDADASITSGMVNQTYSQLAPGNYYNTETGATVFQNNSSLYLPSGTMHGYEVSSVAGSYATTGNGGNFVLNAPVVRLGGNIDVSGFIKNGQMGNGGSVIINSAFLYQNGNIYANGANGGLIQTNVGAMTMGPNAVMEAKGLNGAGGRVEINATGAVDIAQGAIIDTSGEIIGTYNTNVIQIEGGLVNLDGIVRADGLNPGQRGGIVNVVAKGNTQALDENLLASAGGTFSPAERSTLTTRDSQLRANSNGDVTVGLTGEITANGADGTVGVAPSPEDGGDGGLVDIFAARDLVNNGQITANGGNGSTNPNPAVAPVVDGYTDGNGNYYFKAFDGLGNEIVVDEHNQLISTDPTAFTPLQIQASFGQDGGNGGYGGAVVVNYGKNINNDNGLIAARGGNGGDGQFALADTPGAGIYFAFGGNGGNGGNGGLVDMTGGPGANLPSQTTLNNIDVGGSSGGQGGGTQLGQGACGCEVPGADGGCGVPGQVKYRVSEIPPTPPKSPPPPTGIAPFPREYPRIGNLRPGSTGPVLSYNRSIFMARAPLPIIEKRKPAPPKPYQQIVSPPVVPQPKPAPPQRKTTVRGYW